MAMNTVTLVGNLTDDPELRYTSSGQAVANFSIAVNRRVKNADAWSESLDGFFRCSCWGEMAENVSESLKKGVRVLVSGRLEQRTWGEGDGKRSAVEVKVEEIGPSLRFATATVERSNKQKEAAGVGSWGS